MKKRHYFYRGIIIVVTLIFCLIFCQKENTTEAGNRDNSDISVPEGCVLVWNDEFDASAIDSNKWEHEVNGKGGGNNELQYYTDREVNSRVENGVLIIQARKEQYTGPDGTREYTSARMRTAGKGDWKYGRFEIRARLPEGQGLWPALWMLSTYGNYGGWAASGEIDIMEELGQEPNRVYGTLHYGASWPNNVQKGRSFVLPEGTFSEDFHTFVLKWDTTRFQWFVDDSLYSTVTSWYTEGHAYPAPFDQKFHLIFNVAVGGDWPGSPDGTTVFPQQMVVDYVRVFQKEE
jgi:beta-glucanase (GH16 family)